MALAILRHLRILTRLVLMTSSRRRHELTTTTVLRYRRRPFDSGTSYKRLTYYMLRHQPRCPTHRTSSLCIRNTAARDKKNAHPKQLLSAATCRVVPLVELIVLYRSAPRLVRDPKKKMFWVSERLTSSGPRGECVDLWMSGSGPHGMLKGSIAVGIDTFFIFSLLGSVPLEVLSLPTSKLKTWISFVCLNQ